MFKNYKLYINLSLITLLLPLFFLEYFPDNPFIGRYAIAIYKLAVGSWKTIFWIDFLILSIIFFAVSRYFKKIK